MHRGVYASASGAGEAFHQSLEVSGKSGCSAVRGVSGDINNCVSLNLALIAYCAVQTHTELNIPFAKLFLTLSFWSFASYHLA